MKTSMADLSGELHIEGLVGVGDVALDFGDEPRVSVLIGPNGIGKTKIVEALFQYLLFTHRQLTETAGQQIMVDPQWVVFSNITDGKNGLTAPKDKVRLKGLFSRQSQPPTQHERPVVYLGSQNRGYIQEEPAGAQPIKTLKERRQDYFSQIVNGMANGFSRLNMPMAIEHWFVERAQSANPYQKQEDNREVELKTLLQLLHAVDSRIDAHFLEVGGGGRVAIKVDGQKKNLAHLSSGFASLVKIMQAIIAGYGAFTNEARLQDVKGVVLIDELESHLHLAWQVKLIPQLKRLFPNTRFVITTHSSLLIPELAAGDVLRLSRDEDGIVRSRALDRPGQSALIDILKDAFDVDLNALKRERMSPEAQQQAKALLLKLVS